MIAKFTNNSLNPDYSFVIKRFGVMYFITNCDFAPFVGAIHGYGKYWGFIGILYRRLFNTNFTHPGIEISHVFSSILNLIHNIVLPSGLLKLYIFVNASTKFSTSLINVYFTKKSSTLGVQIMPVFVFFQSSGVHLICLYTYSLR